MLPLSSPAELEARWATLRLELPGLPPVLREPQRDALFYILRGEHVLLNVTTGEVAVDS
jgi:hypothetical protein